MILVMLVIVAAALSAVHMHANPSEHHSCVLCKFTSTLSLFILTIAGTITGKTILSLFHLRYEAPSAVETNLFFVCQPVLRAPPALLTA